VVVVVVAVVVAVVAVVVVVVVVVAVAVVVSMVPVIAIVGLRGRNTQSGFIPAIPAPIEWKLNVTYIPLWKQPVGLSDLLMGLLRRS
jgi:hypothetical protein